MAEDSIDRQLQIFFSKSTVSDWKQIAMQETGGKDPFETLSWAGKDDILFLPYYDSETTNHLQYLRVLTAAASEREMHTWLNLPLILVTDHTAGNALAIEHLNQGANGVLFDLNNTRHIDFALLIKEIKDPSRYLFFRGVTEKHLVSLLQAIDDNNIPFFSGTLFWETPPKTTDKMSNFFSHRNFRALGVTVQPSSPSQEIADALATGVRMFDTLSGPNDRHQVFHAICFSMPADASFLETASKMKALRLLWFQVARYYGHNDYKLGDLHIHARSIATTDDNYAPHENMLKATFASMAAVAGGCNSLTIEGRSDTSLFRRWSRNVSHILREESFFDAAIDPLAGSYAADAMTHEIAKKAWCLFQQKAGQV